MPVFMPRLIPALEAVLLPAYAPCMEFAEACRDMCWAPATGHVPRGFCGATSSLSEVQLVLVGAEPGDPHKGENYPAGAPPVDQLQSAYAYAYECFRSGKDLYHQNMRHILELCWPDESFEQHMRKAWITDSVLCSAAVEGGPVPTNVARACRRRYLDTQIALFPRATVVALGRKAHGRLAGQPGVIRAFAVAPPGCNFRKAQESWHAVACVVRSRAAQVMVGWTVAHPAATSE